MSIFGYICSIYSYEIFTRFSSTQYEITVGSIKTATTCQSRTKCARLILSSVSGDCGDLVRLLLEFSKEDILWDQNYVKICLLRCERSANGNKH